MRAQEAAQIFHDWAVAEGLMVEQALPTKSVPEDFRLVSPVSSAGKTLLRQKRILSIGFNNAAREVTAFTQYAAPKRRQVLDFLPSLIEDVRIKYRQGSHVVAGDAPPVPFGGPAYVVRTTAAGGKYTCGSSISVGNCVDAGTLGALVRNAAGTIFGLSNNHVTASCNCAEIGLPIVAPGLADVIANGLEPFTIGLHAQALPLAIGSPTVVNVPDNTDAAIFKIGNLALVSSYQGGAFDTPAAAAPLVAGMTVKKVGRTTGLTTGQVINQLIGAFGVNYRAPQYGFAGTIYFNDVFVVAGVGSPFSDSGDSGSLVVSDIQGVDHAVGIVFAGMADAAAPGGKLSLVLPIEPVLHKLGVTLVSGHNL